jgi:hypothetical protein
MPGQARPGPRRGIIAAMTRYLNLETWSRRAAFEYFRGFDQPYF